jgi:hypothetical protein
MFSSDRQGDKTKKIHGAHNSVTGKILRPQSLLVLGCAQWGLVYLGLRAR